jgi:type I restriction-modification system DNA methylase subunit
MVPEIVNDLCARFVRNREQYRSASYNEAQLRQEFLNPLFKALGWDMENEQGFAEAYKDVVHEDSIRVEGSVKAPDYCFRIGGTKKFFLEAKKPSVFVKDDAGPAYQLRRYAWSAKLPLSILTNFEELAVYDCRYRPAKEDKASSHRLLYVKQEEYASRWEEVASVFTRNAILKGSFDKYAADVRGKRGTQEVDDEFLSDIEEWRTVLARNLALRNKKLAAAELNFAVGRTIDRLLFLRVCEDRRIEEYGQIKALLKDENKYKRLLDLFKRADERYNSGLFHFRAEKGRHEQPDVITTALELDDKVLKGIIETLYYPESPYEFSVFPADILGQVYEQFLGKVIVSKGKTVDVEFKPEVKKAGGVYYTPTYIVDYIVKQTVGKLLDGKTPKEVETLRVLDPACGSGSFLIGAYQYLLDWHLGQYEDKSQKTKKPKSQNEEKVNARNDGALCQNARGEWRLTLAERKRILLNNIYGVDIDAQAVEVTKLSLLLKVLEGESEATVQGELKLRHHALPDLGDNIKCGNSLISPDFSKMFPYLPSEELSRVNPFDWKSEFPEGGFDAVIGNPPYGAEFTENIHSYLKERFVTHVLRGESYLLFAERAISLLAKGGQFGYIIPDTYLNLEFTQHLREYLLRNTLLREIVVLPSRVFKTASVDTTLLFAERMILTNSFHESSVEVRVFDKKTLIKSVVSPQREFSVNTANWFADKAFNVQTNDIENVIVERALKGNDCIESVAEMFSGIKVYEVGKGTPPQTEKTRDTKPFTSPKRENKSFHPLYDGKHIGRYVLLWKDDNWIKYGPWLAAPRDPNNFLDEKILIRKIVGRTLIASYVRETSYCNTLLFVLKIKPDAKWSYPFMLGVLNSTFIGWYYRKKFQISAMDTFPQIMIRDILKIPIPNPTKARHDKLVKLVERMLELNRTLADTKAPEDRTKLERQIAATDGQIDAVVYELYGLTEEEIGIVEKKS